MSPNPLPNSDPNPGQFQSRKGRADRFKRFKREEDEAKRPRVSLTEFDHQLLELLDRYRLLDSNQILHEVQRWPVKDDPRRKGDGRSKRVILGRLQKLFHAGFIDRPPQQLSRRWAERLATSHMVYALGYHGHLALHGEGEKSKARALDLKNRNRQAHFIEHRVGLSRLVLTLKHAAEEEELDFEWIDGRDFREQYLREVPVKDRRRVRYRDGREETEVNEYTLPFNPDTFLKLAGNHYFLEYDTGTEPVRRQTFEKTSIMKKLRAYWAFFESDLHYQHQVPGFQVLFVVGPRRSGDSSKSRLSSMLDLAQDVHASRMFLFTTSDNVRIDRPADILRQPIWYSSVDNEPMPLLEEER